MKSTRFLKKFTGEAKCVFYCTAGTKTVLGVLQLRFNYFVASFFKAFGINLSKEANENDALAVDAFTPVSFLLYGDDHPSVQISRWLSRTPGLLTHTGQPRTRGFKVLSISGRILSERAFPATFPVLS